jgi:7-cyano-7-deazaguanine synthase in queuosine biosynthesis
MLNFALSVYTADVRVGRIHTEDRWTRDFILYFPVTDTNRWNEVSSILVRMLSFLTGDRWDIQFRERAMHSEAAATPVTGTATKPSGVCLFSGGLDSFVGAIDILESKDDSIALVGHYGAGSAHVAQKAAWRALDEAYSGRTRPIWCYVQPPKEEGGDVEQTMRSRSILFLGLGVVAASALGSKTPLWVPENGLISINVPLTHARAGSLSTRTTHPHFLGLFQNVLAALDLPVEVRTHYRFYTKGEMLQQCANQDLLRAGASTTMSCSHPDAGRYQGRSPGKHCGYCIPCLIRRASLNSIGLDRPDDYDTDVVADPPGTNTTAGKNRRALEIAIERARGLSTIQTVAEVLHSGPIPPEDAGEYAAVFRRGLEEVARLFESHKKT